YFSFYCLKSEIIEEYCLKFKNYPRELYEGDGKRVSLLYNWSDESNSEKEVNSTGTVCEIDKDFLLKLISDKEQYLLFECEIRRKLNNNRSTYCHVRYYYMDMKGDIKFITENNYSY